MKHWISYILIVVCILAVGQQVAMADTMPVEKAPPATTQAPAPAPAPVADQPSQGNWLDTFHKPADWLTLSADVRLRWEYWKNNTTFDSGTRENITSRFRYRLRLGGTASIDKDIDFNVRMVYEPMTYLLPNDDNAEKAGTAGPTRINEALFDKFNFTIRNFLELPVTAVIGRQDLFFGKGWLIADGGPMDTSRTGYFDAIRFTWTMDKDNSLDLIYAHDMAQEDMWLHPINAQELAITEQDEHDAMLYWTNKSFDNTVLEAYYLYKNDNPVDHAFPNSGGLAPANSHKDEISTFGGAVSQKLDLNWDYRVEGAIQGGNKADASGKMRDLQAWGTNNVLTYKYNDLNENASHIGWEYLTGDKRSTNKIEQFDPLWGEWARWSDLYANATGIEAGTQASTSKGEWTNLDKFNVGHSIKLSPEWTVTGDYFFLLAPEHPLAGSDERFGNGYVRGHLLEAYLKYQCSKQFSAYLQGEYFFPGNYYSPDDRDEALFVRLNIEYVF
jgi:hypothetical protein